MDIGLTDQATARPVSAGRSPFREHMRRFARWSRRHPRLAWVTAAAAVCLVLFWCYLRQAQTYQLNADPAGQALQAWDMLHGNLLLRGWWLGDVLLLHRRTSAEHDHRGDRRAAAGRDTPSSRR